MTQSTLVKENTCEYYTVGVGYFMQQYFNCNFTLKLDLEKVDVEMPEDFFTVKMVQRKKTRARDVCHTATQSQLQL